MSLVWHEKLPLVSLTVGGNKQEKQVDLKSAFDAIFLKNVLTAFSCTWMHEKMNK